jgi:hypothetical protein
LPSPAWSLRSASNNDGVSVVDALNASLAAKYGDFMYSALTNLTANASSSYLPLPWVTYDTADYLAYGDVPVDQTIPQTGFVQSAADTYTFPTAIFTPGVVPEPTLWVPEPIGSGFF